MSRLSKNHETLTNGVGKCSVPMWRMGAPAGFCDEPAYGPEQPGQRRYGDWVPSRGRWMAHYIPALACYHHGGPRPHQGDPCVQCQTPHDDVAVGICPR